MPQFDAPDSDYLNLASDVLSSGKSSRLYKRLVYDDQIASDVAAYVDINEIGGRFVIRATAGPGQSLEKVERAIDEELARYLESGPTAEELQRVKTQFLAGFIRGVEQLVALEGNRTFWR